MGARASARLFSLIFRQRRNYLYVHSSAGYWTRQELIASVLAPFCFLISNSHHHITILERLTAFFLALRPRNQPQPAFPSSNMAAGCCSGAAEAQGTSAHPADPHAPHDHGSDDSHGHGHDHGYDHEHGSCGGHAESESLAPCDQAGECCDDAQGCCDSSASTKSATLTCCDSNEEHCDGSFAPAAMERG